MAHASPQTDAPSVPDDPASPPRMDVLLLSNPISGRGGARRRAARVHDALRAAGHHVAQRPTPRTPDDAELEAAISRHDAVVVVGGDGSARAVAPLAAATNVPLYHYAAGTENLFARLLGVRPTPRALIDALARPDIRRLDLGHANGEPFLLMASIGFDAAVVHDLDARRGGSITHLSYLPPIFRQLRRWRPPRFSVTVDGAPLLTNVTGGLVVANAPEYGGRLDPLPKACADDGRLDLVHIPVRNAWGMLPWMIRFRLRRTHRSLTYAQGRTIVVESDTPLVYQLDGDPPRTPIGGTRLELTAAPGVVPAYACGPRGLIGRSGADAASDSPDGGGRGSNPDPAGQPV